MCTHMSFTGSAPAVLCALICFALNVPSPSAPHPPHLGGIWIGSANGIRICDNEIYKRGGFLAWVKVPSGHCK
jgi:hypothetical protein